MEELQAILDRLIALAKQSQKANCPCPNCGRSAINIDNDIICIVGHTTKKEHVAAWYGLASMDGMNIEPNPKLGRIVEVVAMTLWGERQ
jgi:hypothetical protein